VKHIFRDFIKTGFEGYEVECPPERLEKRAKKRKIYLFEDLKGVRREEDCLD